MQSLIDPKKSLPICWLTSEAEAEHTYLFVEYAEESLFSFLGAGSTRCIKMIDFSPSSIRVDDFIQSRTEQLAKLTFNKVSYALSQAQATEIVRLAVAARRRPPEFSLYSGNTSSRAEAHNCTSFILSLLNQVGVNVGSRALHMIFGIASPASYTTDGWMSYVASLVRGAPEGRKVARTCDDLSNVSDSSTESPDEGEGCILM